MPEQFNVDFPGPFTIPENKESLLYILDHLFDPQGAALPSLVSAIQYENKPKFGPSAISNLRFEVTKYDPVSLKGRVRVLYDMQLTFGCEDAIKTHHDQHSYYNFSFILSQALFHFESDAPGTRSTADEF